MKHNNNTHSFIIVNGFICNKWLEYTKQFPSPAQFPQVTHSIDPFLCTQFQFGTYTIISGYLFPAKTKIALPTEA
jgi:hypothetical protein